MWSLSAHCADESHPEDLEHTHWQVVAWTDSTIVIHWLDGSPRRFKTYVGNRISFILRRLPSKNWHHVRGEQNPADCASRGLCPKELSEHDLWWFGPAWMKQNSTNWPKQVELTPDTSPMFRKKSVCMCSSRPQGTDWPI